MRVAVLISGGLDSLVAARLLVEQQQDVFGLHLQVGYNDLTDGEVAQLAAVGGFPVKVRDCRRVFQSRIVDYFTEAYLRGETPNPCLWCNPCIKFGLGWEYARQMGAEKIASGHYCRLEGNGEERRLLQGRDKGKEQSYFLALLPRSCLATICFPVGHLTKTEVLHLARNKGLRPAAAKESQDICFIPSRTSCSDFIAGQGRKLPPAGYIEDMQGNILGEHPGIQYFTVGQRRGINCPAQRPYYVAALDAARNRVRVGFREELRVGNCLLDKMNWLIVPPRAPLPVTVKVRYRHPATAALASPLGDGGVEIAFSQPQFGIAPGQGAVLYDGERVVGGGIIRKPPEASG